MQRRHSIGRRLLLRQMGHGPFPPPGATHLEILGKSFIKFIVVLFVFCQLRKELQAFLHNVFAVHFEDLALLEHLMKNVQKKIL